jgi:putative Holliday junction resolvase
VRVGVAVADELGLLAHPRETLDGRDEGKLLAALSALVRAEGIERVVVGLPLDMKGHEGDAAKRVRALADRIERATGVPVELWDERLSTVQAKRALDASAVKGRRQRERIDAAAAVTILQAWMDREQG